MSDPALHALLGTAAATAVFHTLIPDHWLPFVLIGRARGWSVRSTALVSGLSAVIHVGLSSLLALLALGIGLTAARAVGETLERAGSLLLVVFGLVYAFWAWRKGGHFHPGGALLHGGDHRVCGGEEGDANPEHLHYHADEELIRNRPGWGGMTLALVVGANPCVLLIPLMLAGAGRGAPAIGLIVVAYAVPTIVSMAGLSALGVAWGRRIRLPAAARHMEMASGLLIAALGAVLWLADL